MCALISVLQALISLDILVLIDRTSLGPVSSVQESSVLGIGAIVAGVVSAVASVWSAYNQNEANRHNAEIQQQINDTNVAAQQTANNLQRQWALDDYAKVNTYNSPVQQMQRLKEAGLNPRMIYGSSGAANTASMIRSVDAKAAHSDASRMAPVDLNPIGESITGGLSQYMNARQQDTDLKIKEKQLELLDQEKTKRELGIVGQITKNDASAFNLGVQKELRDTTIAKAQVGLVSDYAKNENLNVTTELLRQKYDLNLLESSRLKNVIESSQIQTMIKAVELDMLKHGRSKSDPYYIRAMNNIADIVSQRTGVDMSIVSDVLSIGSRVKMPKKGVSIQSRLRDNWHKSDDFMNRFK